MHLRTWRRAGRHGYPKKLLGQCPKIQEESLYYERKKHDGSLPLGGINTFIPLDGHDEVGAIELMRSSESERDQQVVNVEAFRDTHAEEAAPRLAKLQHGFLWVR